MAMALTTNLLANAILLLFLATASCEAKGMRLRRAIRPGPRLGHKRNPNEKVFNVLQFGAKHDPRKDNALAFIQAWKATCNWAGNARLVVPGGEFLASSMVFQGPCKNPAPIVQIIGTIKAVSDLSNYAEDFWISFEKVNGLIVTGTGTVDGQGQNVWKYNDGGGSIFPANIKLLHVSNGIIRQINSVNPMGFHIGIVLSQNIRARRLHLNAPESSPNTDGFHISQSNQVKIAKSVIATGDDCVGMIHGSTDISIKKVTCGPGHGISIGSLGKYPDEKDVRGILVTNCTLKNTDNGIRIKTWGGSPPSVATSLTFQDIIMDNVRHPIIIDQSYGSKSAPSRVKISNVKYMNIRGTTNSEVGVDIQCSKQVPCEGVRLSNINLKYIGGKKLPFSSSCLNARVSYAGMQFPPPCR
ncbi:Exopolygalacturonase clone GBGE184 precursor, putative [Ricinus communis]|uniref:Exopolygalacturonase clone GBGE184, putative n=1 Tax=Ricinus communis TaxID=3988 RepID=B9RT98_RICCO|nr:Exopolygalacturonase clone GBGE184 precursor, putative [Ricinus communis]|eukprot:XP_002516967.1 exopolygalacturonase clone GBGE184 [Ricinus communis]